MRRLAALAAGLLVATIGAASVVGPVARTAAAGPPPVSAVHRDGRWIVDDVGRVVLLRGVNVVWKAPPFIAPDRPGALSDVDLARIADHGFSVIRLGVAFQGIMPAKGQLDHAYLDAVASVVERAAAHGLRTVIDVHQDLMGAPWGNGFPPWAIRHSPELEALEPDLGFPLNAVRPSHNLAWDAFWSDARLTPTDPQGVVGYLTDAVGALAARLAPLPGMAGLEILNEAWAGTPVLTCAATVVGCPVVDEYVQRTWQRLTDRIRAVAPDLLVWWEPASTWNLTVASLMGTPPLTPAITDPQVAFAFHDYCAFGELSTYLGLPAELQSSCDVHHDITWGNAASFFDRTGLPQMVTEFGNIDDGTELERSLVRSDANLVGWQYWHYGDGFSGREASTEPFSAEQLRHLVRTYPRATAGIPTALSFDPDTGEMRFAYSPGPQAAPTEIAVSDVHYPGGYAVQAVNGTVTSPPGAAVITIEAHPGATRVEVTVRAATAADAVAVTSTTASPEGTHHLPATGRDAGALPLVLALPALATAALVRRLTIRSTSPS